MGMPTMSATLLSPSSRHFSRRIPAQFPWACPLLLVVGASLPALAAATAGPCGDVVMLQRDSARRKIEAAFETRRPLSRPFEMDLPKAVQPVSPAAVAVHPVSPAAVVPSAPVSGGIMKTKGLVHDASGAKSLPAPAHPCWMRHARRMPGGFAQ